MIAPPPAAVYHGQVRRDVFALVAKGDRLLDLGGGTGATARELKRIGRCRYVGVIDGISDHVADLDFAATGDLDQPGQIVQLATAHGPFDTILCLDVLEHLRAPESVLTEVLTALSPGGQLVASIPNVRHVSVIVPLLLRGRWDYADTGVLDRTHLRFFTRSSARALIEGAGFRIDRIVPSATATRWQRLGNLLTLGLLRDLFTIQYYIVAHRSSC